VHHMTRVTVLGVGLGPVSKAEVVFVVYLVSEAHHPDVFCGFFLMAEVEPRVPCVCILGLVFILVGDEFNCGAFFDVVVFDPISGAFAMPLGGSFNVVGEVVFWMTLNNGIDFSRVSEYDG